jgi:hypothetical protein
MPLTRALNKFIERKGRILGMPMPRCGSVYSPDELLYFIKSRVVDPD